MPMGKTFQERNATFEHMYAPGRAKELFKRHKEIHDYALITSARLAWERKTRQHELQKNITLFQRRGDILYQKLKEVEDRYFAEFGKMEEQEEEQDVDDLRIRPATHLGMSERRNTGALDQRPATSHPTLITTPKQPPVYQRSRPNSAADSLPKSKPKSRPASGLKHRATTASGVRFALDEDKDDYHGLTPLPVERPPDLPVETSRFLRQRARRKSVFALTKAKQYELRNEGFKEDIMIFQEELKDKIDDFLYRVDRYKEEYKKSLQSRNERPKPSGSNVNSSEDVSGHNNMSDKFKVKLTNPYANNKSYSLTTPNPDLYSKSHESIKSTGSVRSILHQKSETSINDDALKSPKSTERVASRLSSTSTGAEAKTPLNKQTITRTLSIASRTSNLSVGKTKEELMRERVKLLYLDAHGELDDPLPETLQEMAKKTPKNPQRHQSDLVLNTKEIEEAFEEFMHGKQEPEDLKRLVAMTAKMKHRVRKRRDKSIVPFMAARKAARLWKTAAKMHREKETPTVVESQ